MKQVDDIFKIFDSEWEKLSSAYQLSPQATKNYTQAFCHSSFVHENPQMGADYEQLEFLGDAVLQLIVTKKLLEIFPNEAEGTLSKLRSSIVNQDILAGLAQSIGLTNLLLLGKGENKAGGSRKNSILCDIFEAFVGAIYLEEGIVKASEVVLKIMESSSMELFNIERLDYFDAKTKLQEYTLKHFHTLPQYKIEEKSLENGLYFEASLDIVGSHFSAVDSSKKKAQQLVATQVLQYIKTHPVGL
jgi:ribonuclease-3